MLRIQEWIAFGLILFIVMIVLIPKESFVNSSIVSYKDIPNETEFYKKLYGLNITEFKDELLWMDRCIKIPMSKDLSSFISNASFPIISKTLETESYEDIEQTILTELKNFYLTKNLKTFHGPVYVLIGQSPRLTVVDKDCISRTLAIQFTTIPANLKGLSSYQTISPECTNPPTNSTMSIHIHLLFPTYNTSGKFVYRSWENIKCHLKDLLSERSKEYPCFLTCMKNTNMTCGCINQQTPYVSKCLGDNEQGFMDPNAYNYWNLFIVNSAYVNRIFNANLDSPFFSESVQIKPFDTNLDYCRNNTPILEMNKQYNITELHNMDYYRITHIPSGKCLDDVPRRTTEKIDTCIFNDNQYWMTESVPGKEGFYLKNKLTKRYLKAYYNSSSQKISVTTTEKYSYTTLQRWSYENYLLKLLDPIQGTTIGVGMYLYMMNDKLTLITFNQIQTDPALLTNASSLPGILLGVGGNNYLYTKTSLTSRWILADKSRSIIKVHVLKNKLIIGVGTDYQMYTKQKLSSPWVLVSSSENTYDIAEMLDGNLLIVGTDNKLYTKQDLYSPRVLVDSNNVSLRGIHVLRDGKILGVGTNNYLYTKTSLTTPWVLVNGTCCFRDVFEMPDGTILGTHTNYRLYTKANLTAPWVIVSDDSSAIGIAFLENKADVVETLTRTWNIESVTQQETMRNELESDYAIDNRELRNYLLSL